ncbi:MAG: metallophosphoesterase family protein [Thermoleophilia bacterium]|nr:metallophosphoesterase family protein [Thermoleophilia bacterium]
MVKKSATKKREAAKAAKPKHPAKTAAPAAPDKEAEPSPAAASSGASEPSQAARSARRPRRAAPVRIGVLSDTHGYLDPQVLEVFAGVRHIIHAGDVMDAAILSELETVAPVTAVAGNLDRPDVVGDLPRQVAGEVDGIRFVVGHKPKRLQKRIARGKLSLDDLDLVVAGHEHVPSAVWIDGVLHLNPGTASSPEEEDDGPTVAVVEKLPTGLSVRFVPLAARREPAGG